MAERNKRMKNYESYMDRQRYLLPAARKTAGAGAARPALRQLAAVGGPGRLLRSDRRVLGLWRLGSRQTPGRE